MRGGPSWTFNAPSTPTTAISSQREGKQQEEAVESALRTGVLRDSGPFNISIHPTSDKRSSRKLGGNEKCLGKEEECSELSGPHLGVLHHRRNPPNHVGDALAHGRHLLRFIELRREDVVPLIALERTMNYCCFLTYFLCPSHRLLLTFLFHILNPVFRRVLGKACGSS